LEHIFKPIGAVLVMLCCYLASFSISSKAKKEADELEAFILLMRKIRAEISCFSRPLCEIYAGFESEVFERSGFIKALKENGLDYALDTAGDKLSLREENFAVLKQFAMAIGKNYRDEEIKTCDYYISQLSERHKAHRDAIPKNNKLSRSLCFLFGISIIIILI